MCGEQRRGFTLVELSIVLVIIGLIVGGVVGGRSLIHSARLNSVVKEVQEFQVAIRAFELQYDYLPGDWPDAQAFYPNWVGPADDEKDGDGDGNIAGGAEGRMFFKHLSLTGLIQGTYHKSGSQSMPGVNTPAGALPDSAYSVQEKNWGGIPEVHFRIHKIVGNQSNSGVLNGRDAKAIDKKIDDGGPRTGDVRARVGVYIPAYTEACRNVYPLATVGVTDCILAFDYIK